LNAGFGGLSVRQSLPTIGIPLRSGDSDVALDLAAVLRSAYDRGAWDLQIDYSKPPLVPMKPNDAKWAKKLLREKGIR
jgi:hypothetical protein